SVEAALVLEPLQGHRRLVRIEVHGRDGNANRSRAATGAKSQLFAVSGAAVLVCPLRRARASLFALMAPLEADPFGAAKKAAAVHAPAMALSSQPKEVAEEVQRQAQLRRVDKDIEHLMRARYPLIYILSSEEKRVERSIADVLHLREKEKNYKTKIYTWSVTEGVRLGKDPQGDSKDPLKALRFVVEAKPDERAVFILRDLHAYLKNPEVVRLLRDIGRKLKEELKTVFLISPLLAIPPELDKEVAVVEYPLPELMEIDAIFDRV